MSDFHRHSKVVCIDATPLPINAEGATLAEFTFPSGFLVKGATYSVIQVGTGSDGQPALRLAGCHVIQHDADGEEGCGFFHNANVGSVPRHRS